MKNIYLKKVYLRDFRNYKKKEIEFSDPITWITGPNGSGKTNVLEAIYLLATGKSSRVKRHEEVIGWGAELASVECQISSRRFNNFSQNLEVSVEEFVAEKDRPDVLEVIVTKGVVGGKRVQGKQYRVNGVPRQLGKFVGYLSVVWFGPEDLDLVTGSGSRRRQFMNEPLIQIDSEYVRAITDYEKALRRRNKLLVLLSEGKVRRTAFGFFDQVILAAGKYIQKKRRELVEGVNEWFRNDNFFGNIKITYDWSEISETRLAQYVEQEVAAGMTLVGPHRDEVVVEMNFGGDNWQRLDRFGSRGQQRMGALGLKMGELEFMSKKLDIRPVLLLDDIFSELDEKHRKVVMEVMRKQQSVVTGVEKQDLNYF